MARKIPYKKKRLSPFPRIMLIFLVIQFLWYFMTHDFGGKNPIPNWLPIVWIRSGADFIGDFLLSYVWPRNAIDNSYRQLIAIVVLFLQDLPIIGYAVRYWSWIPCVVVILSFLYVWSFNRIRRMQYRIQQKKEKQARKEEEKIEKMRISAPSGLSCEDWKAAKKSFQCLQKDCSPVFKPVNGIRVQRFSMDPYQKTVPDSIYPWDADGRLRIKISDTFCNDFFLDNGQAYIRLQYGTQPDGNPQNIPMHQNEPILFEIPGPHNDSRLHSAFTWVTLDQQGKEF